MKFSAIVGVLLGASAAIAAPGTEARRQRHQRRVAERERQGLPRLPADNVAIEGLVNDTEHVSYSSNWAGAVLIGSGYKSVTGTFTVPTPKVPSGGSSSTTYSASAWVGIDGDTCTTAILQTGLDFTVRGSSVSYDAWYEWYPDYAYDFSGISFSAGDSVKVTVTATSTKAGTATIQNLTTGKSVTHTFSSQSASLCETNAEWIVEDYESNGSLVPLANFGTVTFTSASATTSSGSVGVSGATIIDIKQGSTVYTDVTASGSTVTVEYV